MQAAPTCSRSSITPRKSSRGPPRRALENLHGWIRPPANSAMHAPWARGMPPEHSVGARIPAVLGKASTHTALEKRRHRPHRHEVGTRGPRQATETKSPPRAHPLRGLKWQLGSEHRRLYRPTSATKARRPKPRRGKPPSRRSASMPGKGTADAAPHESKQLLRKHFTSGGRATQALQGAHLGTPLKVAQRNTHTSEQRSRRKVRANTDRAIAQREHSKRPT